MLLTPRLCPCPFDVPNLRWCEVAFTPSAATQVSHDGITVPLPDTLMAAVPKRRSEFLAGRLCAAMVLRDIGQPQHVGILNRAPIWPAGVVGSISHNDSRAVAVVSQHYTGVGVDVEEVMPRERAQKLHLEFMQGGEVSLRPADMGFADFTTLVFSAKEAFYKSVSARVKRVLGFHEVTLKTVEDDGLMLEFEGGVCPVQWRIQDGTCLTLAVR